MFKRKPIYLDDDTYKISLRSKDFIHRFRDQLRSNSKKYEVPKVLRILDKWKCAKRRKSHERAIRRIEKDGYD